jgi:hypothetical protein
MAIERRTFLKSVFTGSALLAGVTPVRLTATQSWKQIRTSSDTPTILVQAGTSLDEVFIKGIEAASQANSRNPFLTMALDPLKQTDPIILQQIFSSLKRSRLVGLMEDVPFTIFQAVARTHGARFLFTGQHSWGFDEPYNSRHQLLTVPQCQGVSSVLAASLSASNQGYFISETSLGSDQGLQHVDQSPLANTSHWAAMTGEILATISMGNWQPGRVGKFQRKQRNNIYGNSGSLVSFVIEI